MAQSTSILLTLKMPKLSEMPVLLTTIIIIVGHMIQNVGTVDDHSEQHE